MRRGLEGIVIPGQSQRHAHDGEELAAAASFTLATSLPMLVGVQERGNRNGFLGFLIDHERPCQRRSSGGSRSLAVPNRRWGREPGQPSQRRWT